MKICGTCGSPKRLTAFNKDRRSPDGKQTKCRACVRQYYETNKTALLAAGAARRAKDPEKVNRQGREYWRRQWQKPERRYIKYRYTSKGRCTFRLTLAEFKAIVAQPCAYGTGVPDTTIINGIDRKDSKQGYTKDNSVPCCAFHNFAKWRLLSYVQMRAAMDAEQLPCSNVRPVKSERKH